jgi:four helix bundle protein
MLSYENLEVYKKSFSLNQTVYRFLKQPSPIPPYFKNQLGRASLRIMLNIAEGSAKFSNKDRRNFFVIARGSAFECTSIVKFRASENEVKPEMEISLCSGFEEISKMLYAMIKNLNKSEYPGRV